VVPLAPVVTHWPLALQKYPVTQSAAVEQLVLQAEGSHLYAPHEDELAGVQVPRPLQ
jgi:hypothetical protein